MVEKACTSISKLGPKRRNLGWMITNLTDFYLFTATSHCTVSFLKSFLSEYPDGCHYFGSLVTFKSKYEHFEHTLDWSCFVKTYSKPKFSNWTASKKKKKLRVFKHCIMLKKQTGKKLTGTNVFTKMSSSFHSLQKLKERQKSQTNFNDCIKPRFSHCSIGYPLY